MGLQAYAVKYGDSDECHAAFCLYTISRRVEDCWRCMPSLNRVNVQKWILGTNRVLKQFDAKLPAHLAKSPCYYGPSVTTTGNVKKLNIMIKQTS